MHENETALLFMCIQELFQCLRPRWRIGADEITTKNTQYHRETLGGEVESESEGIEQCAITRLNFPCSSKCDRPREKGACAIYHTLRNGVRNSRIFELVFLRLGTSYTSAVNVTGKPIH